MAEGLIRRWGVLALVMVVSACGDTKRAPSSAEPPAASRAHVLEDGAGGAPAPVAEAPPAPPAAPPSEAGPERIAAERSPELTRCLASDDAARGVSVAMGGCFNAELARQDALLNAAYARAMAARDPAARNRLRAEERGWIGRRDEGCAEATTGGTIDQVEIPACLLDETIARRLVLEAATG